MNKLDATASETPQVLKTIAESVAKRVFERKNRASLNDLKKIFPLKRAPHDLTLNFDHHLTNVIAEIKPKSPSEGVLKKDFKILDLASQYSKGGARAFSILTEEDHFGGSLKNLELVRREFLDVPLLMKDFIIDEYQIYEGALAGADAILLIVALLDESKLVSFSKLATSLGLSSLVEVHTESELEIAMKHKFPLIGVNNRNLKTLEISLETSRNLAGLCRDKATLICESGLQTPEQIKEMKQLGFQGFLIGSSLMKSGDPQKKLAELIELSR